MNTKKLLSAAFVAAALTVIYFPPGRISAQSVNGKFGDLVGPTIQMEAAGTTSGMSQRTSYFGVMDPIGLHPGEQIGINLIVASDRINYPVGLAPVDGGEISAPANLYVTNNGNNGKVSFSFRGGNTTGLYRVLVNIGPEHYQLQLYVAPPRDSWNCPPPP